VEIPLFEVVVYVILINISAPKAEEKNQLSTQTGLKINQSK
jgi:hypothetical protein